MLIRVAKGWNISGKFPWEVKLGNFGNIKNLNGNGNEWELTWN